MYRIHVIWNPSLLLVYYGDGAHGRQELTMSVFNGLCGLPWLAIAKCGGWIDSMIAPAHLKLVSYWLLDDNLT